MILAAFLLLGQAISLAPPLDWTSLPRLSLASGSSISAQLTEFAQNEVRDGRCSLGERSTLDLAVLVAENGRVRRIVPRAIDCPSVEQFAAGVVLRAARDRIRPPATATWYVTTIALLQP
ncbi:hypothetical protein [uncultured Sphingomonas sp.]|uniref:hypothetical protein n=1 Tax=uncultured Sphingomonas sp. TaxID=158754 RepID=UPI0037485FC8